MIALPGCSLIPTVKWGKQPDPEPVIITKLVEPKVFHPPLPRPVNLQNPQFYVVSPANFEEFKERIEKENAGVFFALTPGDYQILATNLQELRRYILQSREVIVYYRKSVGAKDEKKQPPQVTDE